MICIIPARGGSKRIPRKNIKDFFGKPMITYPIKVAMESQLFERVIVSTDDSQIAKISIEAGAEVPFLRSKENSNDSASTASVLKEILTKLGGVNKDYKEILCLYPCTPLIEIEHLVLSFQKFKEENLNSLATIQKFKNSPYRSFLRKRNLIRASYPDNQLKRTQDLPDLYHDAGQFYWIKSEVILNNIPIFNQNTGFFELDELEAQDIDTPNDWLLAELKYNLKNGNQIL